jgi:DNA-binding NtrC family response regulator
MTSYPVPPNYANRVLVASPSHLVRQRVLDSLRSPARRVAQASGGAEALVQLESGSWQVLFLDRRLPDLDSEELSQTVRQRFPGIEVVLLDPENDAALAVAEEKSNALPEMWPPPQGNSKNEDSSNQDKCEAELRPATRPPRSILEDPLPGMIGDSRIMQPVYHLARLLAPRTTTVLITGPTGCGKEVVARALHHLSPRAGRAFAVVNCAAIPETLLEAELFGYARGAFTGAMQSYAGRIQAAQGGTLFLDEIGEMPLSLQPKLLRFLEQKELQRLGSSEVVRVDARVVSATNAHLLSLMREGKFREDLYYRISAFPIEIPPLRDRTEDIRPLATHFLKKYASGSPVPELSAEALEVLRTQPWAGNIRELQNVMERALILCEDEPVIRPEHLGLAETSVGNSH